jgi:hypothetical protein
MKPRINSAWWKVESFILSGFFALQALLWLWVIFDGLSNYQDAADFENKAISSVGIITKTIVTESPVVSGYSVVAHTKKYESTVQFKTKEDKIIKWESTNLCQQKPSELCDGIKVQILYASDNPQLAMIEGGTSPSDRAMDKIKLGIILLLLSSVTIFIAIRENRNE